MSKRIFLSLYLYAITISIFDLPHDTKRVVVEACEETMCVSVVVNRDELDSDATIDLLVRTIQSNTVK